MDYTVIWQQIIQTDICLFKVNNDNTKTMCEICSKLTTKTLVRYQFCFKSRIYGFDGRLGVMKMSEKITIFQIS